MSSGISSPWYLNRHFQNVASGGLAFVAGSVNNVALGIGMGVGMIAGEYTADYLIPAAKKAVLNSRQDNPTLIIDSNH